MPVETIAKKRGRPGDKIARAFASIGTTPVPVAELMEKYGVSEAVLRQAKRFDKTGLGTVSVKKLAIVVPATGARLRILGAWRTSQ